MFFISIVGMRWMVSIGIGVVFVRRFFVLRVCWSFIIVG